MTHVTAIISARRTHPTAEMSAIHFFFALFVSIFFLHGDVIGSVFAGIRPLIEQERPVARLDDRREQADDEENDRIRQQAIGARIQRGLQDLHAEARARAQIGRDERRQGHDVEQQDAAEQEARRHDELADGLAAVFHLQLDDAADDGGDNGQDHREGGPDVESEIVSIGDIVARQRARGLEQREDRDGDVAAAEKGQLPAVVVVAVSVFADVRLQVCGGHEQKEHDGQRADDRKHERGDAERLCDALERL